MLGEPLEGAYLALAEPTLWRRFLTLARDRQIWKDLAWLAVLSAVGFSFGLVALVLWPTALWLLSSPVWWSIVPRRHPPRPLRRPAEHAGRGGLAGACGLGLVLVTPWIGAGLARAQALLARFFLAPGPRARVGALERSRAAAVRTSEEERRRLRPRRGAGRDAARP